MVTKNNRKKICLSIEGNIGAGKSTFLKILSQTLDIEPIFEPHEQWQAVGAIKENLLEKFYQETNRWAYTFQSYAFITRILKQESHMSNSNHHFFITERSVYSDRYCFAKNCFAYGNMTALEWELYQEWFSWLTEKYNHKPDGFIYLRTDPEICYSRLIKRNRSEETNISLQYLKSIHEKHELWLTEKKVDSSIKAVPVLTLASNDDFENNSNIMNENYKQIENFLQLLAHDQKKLK